MDKKVYELLNEQIQKEFYSAYLYLGMANYYDDAGLDGFANWFSVQAQEEMDHAMLFRKYLLNHDEEVELLVIDAPPNKYDSFGQPLDDALKHEKYVTESINNIYDAAQSAKDFQTTEFLNWFLKEQVEEEKNASDLIKWYELFGGESKGRFSLDAKLGARMYVAPTLTLE